MTIIENINNTNFKLTLKDRGTYYLITLNDLYEVYRNDVQKNAVKAITQLLNKINYKHRNAHAGFGVEDAALSIFRSLRIEYRNNKAVIQITKNN
jgi:hypothetical protein